MLRCRFTIGAELDNKDGTCQGLSGKYSHMHVLPVLIPLFPNRCHLFAQLQSDTLHATLQVRIGSIG